MKVTGVDFAYDDLPEKAEVGTVLTLTNESDQGAPRAGRLPPPGIRDPPDVRAGEAARGQLLGLFAGPPAMVLLAPPGGGPRSRPWATGRLKDAGRYAVVCTIPTGADPAAYLQAAQAGRAARRQVAGGPPHFTQGMFGEIVVE